MGTGGSKPLPPTQLDAHGQKMLPFSFFYPSRKVMEIFARDSTEVLFTFRNERMLHHDWRLYTGLPPVAPDGAVQEPHLLQVEPRGMFKGGMRITAGSPHNSPLVNDLLPCRHGWAFHFDGESFLWREVHGRQEVLTHGKRRDLLCFRTSPDSKVEYDLVGVVDWLEYGLAGAMDVGVGPSRVHKAGKLWLAPAVVERFEMGGGALRLFELLVATGVTSLQLLQQRRAANKRRRAARMHGGTVNGAGMPMGAAMGNMNGAGMGMGGAMTAGMR